MIRTTLLSLGLALGLASGASAAGDAGHIEDFDFSFEGPFGAYDQLQLQRGLKVYTEVCAGCHGLKQVYFRNLSEDGGPGFSEDQMKAYTSQFSVLDEDANHHLYDRDAGELRPLVPSDKFPAVENAGAPDLSLMAKARAGFTGPYGTGLNPLFKGIGGPEYIASILTGYTGEEKEQAGTILYENTAFPGGWISMAPPLYGEDVEFDDGHSNDIHHESEDVAAFLMWAAEPKMMARKQAGLVAVAMLVLLSVLLYLTNKALWAPIKHRSA